jgi:hypothetical protein
MGMLNCMLSNVGGAGSAGVSGAGSEGVVADALRTLGINFGSFCCATGGSAESVVVIVEVQL